MVVLFHDRCMRRGERITIRDKALSLRAPPIHEVHAEVGENAHTDLHDIYVGRRYILRTY